MSAFATKNRVMLLALVALSTSIGGCGPASSTSAVDSQEQLVIFGRLYGQYMADHNGRAPTNEQELLQFLEGSAGFLKSRGIARAGDLLTSPRDNQALVVLYGDEVVEDGPGGLPWIAHESQGFDGKKYVIGARGAAEEKTQQGIEQILSQ